MAGKTFSCIKDSSHFINDIKNIHVDETEILVSFDVVSLYTKVLVEKAIIIIRKITNNEIANFIRICLKSTYFTFCGEFYEQTDGVEMGSLLSSVVANIYMEYFKKKAIDSFPLKPRN